MTERILLSSVSSRISVDNDDDDDDGDDGDDGDDDDDDEDNNFSNDNDVGIDYDDADVDYYDCPLTRRWNLQLQKIMLSSQILSDAGLTSALSFSDRISSNLLIERFD